MGAGTTNLFGPGPNNHGFRPNDRISWISAKMTEFHGFRPK